MPIVAMGTAVFCKRSIRSKQEKDANSYCERIPHIGLTCTCLVAVQRLNKIYDARRGPLLGSSLFPCRGSGVVSFRGPHFEGIHRARHRRSCRMRRAHARSDERGQRMGIYIAGARISRCLWQGSQQSEAVHRSHVGRILRPSERRIERISRNVCQRPPALTLNRLGKLPAVRYRGAIPTVPAVPGSSVLKAPSLNPLMRPVSTATLSPGMTRCARKRTRSFWSGARLR
jgi:hypothetical protein